MHTAAAWTFTEILSSNTLTTSPCDVFKESLLYFFYGRAAYRVQEAAKGVTAVPQCPVVLVLNPNTPITAKRIFPFDSGALKNRYFESHIHPRTRPDEFLLGTDPETPARMVKAFFGSNYAYYLGQVIGDLSFDPLKPALEAYYQLVRATGDSAHDDRRSTVELQTHAEVSLEKQVMAVVLPNALAQSASVRKAIETVWGGEILTYTFFGTSRQGEYHGAIREKLLAYLQEKKLL